MNTKTRYALVKLCETLEAFGLHNSGAYTAELCDTARDARQALAADETVVETGTTNREG